MGRISIVLPDEVEGEIRGAAEVNTRTLTQEVLHRIKLGSEVERGEYLAGDESVVDPISLVDREDEDSGVSEVIKFGKGLTEGGGERRPLSIDIEMKGEVDREGSIRAFIEKANSMERDYVDADLLDELEMDAQDMADTLGIKVDDRGFYEVVDGRRVNLGNWNR